MKSSGKAVFIVVSRLAAKAAGLTRYFTGKPCNVKHHTMTRLDSFVRGTAGKRLTYKGLIA